MTFNVVDEKLHIAGIRPACPVTNGLHFRRTSSNTRAVSYLVAVLRAGVRRGGGVDEDGRRLSRELRAADTLLPGNRRQVNIV